MSLFASHSATPIVENDQLQDRAAVKVPNQSIETDSKEMKRDSKKLCQQIEIKTANGNSLGFSRQAETSTNENLQKSINTDHSLTEMKLKTDVTINAVRQGSTFVIPVTISGTETEAVVDTAADVTILSDKFYQQLSAKPIESRKVSLRTAGRDLKMEGFVTVPASIFIDRQE